MTRCAWIALFGALVAFAQQGLAQGADNFSATRRGAGSPLTHTPIVSADAQAALQTAIERYRQIAADGGWPAIDKGISLRAGDADERVGTLRRRLAVEGDLAAAYASGTEFDANVEDGLKRFQERNGLRASGILNGETLRALNVPAAARLAQLTSSAERLAELLPLTRAGPYVLVNVPSYELQVVAEGRVVLHSRVIVGKPATPTPVVRATIRAVDLMPYWHVPPGIAERAIIPAVRKDPTYLARERIRVFSAWGGTEVDPAQVNWHAPQASRYVFRQDPGHHNALGLVRIDMPNQFTVYMHDTPMKQLFDRAARAHSAGCVRVQSIFQLAGLLVGEDDQAVRRRLEPLLASGTKTTLRVTAPVPVYFVYLTASANAGGWARFRPDIYERDAAHTEHAELGVERASPDPWHTRVQQHLSP